MTNLKCVSFLGLAQTFGLSTPIAQTAWHRSLEMTRAVNMESTTDSASVMAKPLIVPVPRKPRTAAAIRVVMLPSRMADIALWKPALMDPRTDVPSVISS